AYYGRNRRGNFAIIFPSLISKNRMGQCSSWGSCARIQHRPSAIFAGGWMAQSRHEKNVQPSMLARTEDIQQQIQELSGRDLQLWSIGILIMLVLTAGLLALVLPNLVWAQRVIRVEQAYLPQLFFGLISLVLLFNIYLLTQKRTLNSTRHALIRELVLNERLESLSLIDPLTQLLNRRAVNELIPREVARANRLGSNGILTAKKTLRWPSLGRWRRTSPAQTQMRSYERSTASCIRRRISWCRSFRPITGSPVCESFLR